MYSVHFWGDAPNECRNTNTNSTNVKTSTAWEKIEGVIALHQKRGEALRSYMYDSQFEKYKEETALDLCHIFIHSVQKSVLKL